MINTLDDDKIELTKEHRKQIQELIDECESKMVTRLKEKQKVLIFVSQVQPYCPVIDFTQRFKELDKLVFEDETVIKIEGVEK